MSARFARPCGWLSALHANPPVYYHVSVARSGEKSESTAGRANLGKTSTDDCLCDYFARPRLAQWHWRARCPAIPSLPRPSRVCGGLSSEAFPARPFQQGLPRLASCGTCWPMHSRGSFAFRSVGGPVGAGGRGRPVAPPRGALATSCLGTHEQRRSHRRGCCASARAASPPIACARVVLGPTWIRLRERPDAPERASLRSLGMPPAGGGALAAAAVKAPTIVARDALAQSGERPRTRRTHPACAPRGQKQELGSLSGVRALGTRLRCSFGEDVLGAGAGLVIDATSLRRTRPAETRARECEIP